MSPTYVEDLWRVRKKSKELYTLVGQRRIKVSSAAEIAADDVDEEMCASLVRMFEEQSHLTDDEARRLLKEYRANAGQNKPDQVCATDNQLPITEGLEVERTGTSDARDPSNEREENADVADGNIGDASSPARNISATTHALSRDDRLSDPQHPPPEDDEDDLRVFDESVAALEHLQGLLGSYRATKKLTETLEITLAAARESRQ